MTFVCDKSIVAMQSVYKALVYTLLALFAFSSCQKKSVYKELALIKEKNVCMTISNFQIYPEDSTIIEKWNSQNLRFVIYNDSSECASCKVKELEKWNEFIERYSRYPKLGFYMLFSVSGREKSILLSSLKCQDIHVPILIDTIAEFPKKNEQIEKCRMAHCFLIDQQNRVVVLGNPMKNKKVKALLDHVLEERIESGNAETREHPAVDSLSNKRIDSVQ